MSVAAVSALLVLAANPQLDAVHTATRRVHGCAALPKSEGESEDHPARFAAATEGGLLVLDGDGRPLARPLTELDGLPGTRVRVATPRAGHANQLWVGTETGLARVQVDGRRLRVRQRFASAPVRSVVEHAGETYVGTWDAGVLVVDGDALRPVPLPDPQQPWGAQAQRVTALLSRGDALLAATAGAGVWQVEDGQRSLAPDLEQLGHGTDWVWSLATHDGAVYAGTLVGVVRLDGARSRTFGTQDARALASVDGRLLVASPDAGLADVHPGEDTLELPPRLRAVNGLDTLGGRTCVATDEGLWLREADADWRRLLDDGLPSGDVTDLLRVGSGEHARLYVSTFDRGVHVLENDRWRALDPRPGTAAAIDPQANALAAHDGSIFVATARGLYRVDDDSKTKDAAERWTKKRGLPHDNVLSLTTLRDGNLLVGTHAGAVLLDDAGELRSLGTRSRRWAVWAVAEGEAEGEYWLGTTQGLIHWLPNGRWVHLSMLSDHLRDNWVTALTWGEDGSLYVGTYAGGVDRLVQTEKGWTSEALGGGRINPGGLSFVDGTLHAATMKGVLAREGGRWRTLQGVTPFEDATAVLPDAEGVWFASRRGLAHRAE